MRRIVGHAVPVVASYDLHANVSDANVELVNAYIGYRTNPHLDMRERGAESAQVLRRLLAGTKTHLARIRLPIVPPTVSMLTGKDAHERPYGEMIDLGQQRMREPPYAGRVLNVSVMGGFAYADTPFNGLTVVVTATDADAAQSLAREIAAAGWARRERFRATLTSLEDATRLAKARRIATARADLRRRRRQSRRRRPRQHDVDPRGVPQGRRAGRAGRRDPRSRAGRRGASAAARAPASPRASIATAATSSPGRSAAPAVVRRLHDGRMRGRRGIYADNTLALGPCAALQLDGITVVVISNRVQCADPVFFEAFGLDIAAARVVVVKSRGHFRGGFDEFFRHEQVVEVDAPGLTSPVLSRFPWKHMPRPVLPIDAAAEWTAMKLDDLPTPCLVLDRGILQRNIATMARRLARHGVPLRPHMKTAKSIDVARLAIAGQPGGITVSTLAEAEYFAGHGITDILYAVGITPQKLDQVAKLNSAGAAVIVLTDDLDTAGAIAAHTGSRHGR